jgi:FxsC-like protein
MGREFFFSYTRGNNDPYLKKLFDDLSEEVRNLRGLPAGAETGFFDQRNLELGEDWDAALVEALQGCKVMVAIASPGYFKSEYCGKEWALFRERMKAATAPGAKVPPLLKPVVWMPVKIDELPASIAAGHLNVGDPQAIHNARGVRYLLKQIHEQRSAYNEFVEALAKQIVDAADAHPLPALATVPTLANTRSAFARDAAPTPPGGAAAIVLPPAPTGPSHVLFIYVAAHPQAIAGAHAPEAYVETGGADWKPFYPQHTTRVHRFVQSIVAGDDLDFTSEAMPFGPNLIARVDEAWRQRQIVVLIVDPWSLHWDAKKRASPEYQALLRALDARLDYHWCVLVPWNEADADAMAERDAITATVRDTFDRHANLAPNPMFYRDGIASADELRRTLGDVLTRLKEEIKKRAPVAMPIPSGPPKSVVTGPSADT